MAFTGGQGDTNFERTSRQHPQLSAINATPAEVATAKVTENPEAARMEPPSALATTEDATLKAIPT